MSNEENVKVVKTFFAAIGSGDKQALLALVDEGIEWIIPGEDWPLAGTHRGHAGVPTADRHVTSLTGKFPRDREPHAAATAGHDCPLPLKP